MNLRRNFDPSNTSFANNAVISRAGGQYLPHLLTKKSIKSSFVGILLEKMLVQCFGDAGRLVTGFGLVSSAVVVFVTAVIEPAEELKVEAIKVLD